MIFRTVSKRVSFGTIRGAAAWCIPEMWRCENPGLQSEIWGTPHFDSSNLGHPPGATHRIRVKPYYGVEVHLDEDIRFHKLETCA